MFGSFSQNKPKKMSEKFEKIFQEVDEYLKPFPEKYERYNQIIKDPAAISNPIQNFNSILDLVKENRELFNKIIEFTDSLENPEEPIEYVGNFVRLVHSLLGTNKDFIRQFMRLISLYTEDLIVLDFLHYRLDQITMELPEDIRNQIMEYSKKLSPHIAASRDALFYRISKNQNVAKALPQEFILHQSFSPIPMFQMLCMMANLFSDEQIDSCVRCLELFSTQFITRENAVNWISKFNEFIGNFFEEISNPTSFQPIDFHPAKIVKLARDDFKDPQLKWALGEHTFSVVQGLEIPKQITPLQIAVQRKQTERPEDEKDDQNSAQYIADVRAIKMSSEMKHIVGILSGEDASIVHLDDNVVRAVFGFIDQNTITNYPLLYKVLYDNCKKLGEEALDIYDQIIEGIVESMDKSSDEFRIHYKKSIQRPAVLRRLLLKGYHVNKPSDEVLATVKQISSEFYGNVTGNKGENQTIETAFQTLAPGKYMVTEEAAITLYYILTLCHLIDQSNGNTQVNNLASLVLSDQKLNSIFNNSELAQSDLILTRIARGFKSAEISDDINHFRYETGTMSAHYFGDFLFIIEVNDNITFEPIQYPFRPIAE